MKRALLLLAFAWIAGIAPRAAAQVPIPGFDAPVIDLTGTLTAQQQAALAEKLNSFQARKGAQIAVLMLPSTAPEDIAQYGIRLADAWKVGREAPDDGAILIVAKDDRALRIEVGRGLEGALTDATSSRIINETIVPLFKQGDFYGGINAGLDQMTRVVDGEPLPPPDQAWKPAEGIGLPWPALVVAAIVLGSVLRPMLGKLGGAATAGAVGGGLIWFNTSRLALAGAGFVGLFLLTLLFGGFGGPRMGGGGRRGRAYRDMGGWGGGGFGGGGFGGGGFGGGGGGSFGGGGASGRW